MEGPALPHRLVPRAGLAHHGEGPLRFQQAAKALAEDGVVIGDQDADRLGTLHSSSAATLRPHP